MVCLHLFTFIPTLLQFFLLSCMIFFVGKHFLCFQFMGVWRLAALITLNVSKIENKNNLRSFCFTTHPRCLLYLVLFSALTSNTTCSACTWLIYLSDPDVSSQDGSTVCGIYLYILIYHHIDMFLCVYNLHTHHITCTFCQFKMIHSVNLMLGL